MQTGIGIGIGLPFIAGGAGAPVNLLNSTDFSSGWTVTNASFASDTLTENSSTGQHRIYDAGVNDPGGGVTSTTSYVFAVEMKANGRDFARLQFGGTEFGNQDQTFNLGAGTLGTSGDAENEGITDLGGGWYDCWVAATCDTTGTSADVYIMIESADGVNSYAGDGTSGIMIRNPRFYVGTEL